MNKLRYVLFVDYTVMTKSQVFAIKEELDCFIHDHLLDEYEPLCNFIFDYNNEETASLDVYENLRDNMMALWCNEGQVENENECLVVFIMGPGSSNIQNACIKMAEYMAFIPNMKRRTKKLNDDTLLMIAATSDLIFQEFFMKIKNYPEVLSYTKTDTQLKCELDYIDLIDDYISHLTESNETSLETMDCKNPTKAFLVVPYPVDDNDLNIHVTNIKRLLDMRLYDVGMPYPRAKTHVVCVNRLEEAIDDLTPSQAMNAVVAIPFGIPCEWRFDINEKDSVLSDISDIMLKLDQPSRVVIYIGSIIHQGVKFYIYGNNLMMQRLQGETFSGAIIDELREYDGK